MSAAKNSHLPWPARGSAQTLAGRWRGAVMCPRPVLGPCWVTPGPGHSRKSVHWAHQESTRLRLQQLERTMSPVPHSHAGCPDKSLKHITDWLGKPFHLCSTSSSALMILVSRLWSLQPFATLSLRVPAVSEWRKCTLRGISFSQPSSLLLLPPHPSSLRDLWLQ